MANGKIIATDETGHELTIHFNQPVDLKKFHLGSEVEVKQVTKIRSLNQNCLYWAYLTWIISSDGGDLISQGHFSPDALHTDIKAWITDKYPHQFNSKQITRFTTTELNTKEFNEYLAIVDRELMVSFFRINTQGFWGQAESSEVPF